jgi:hypothetical protein
MTFKDLFRPKWKHSDPKIRIAAVKEITEGKKLSQIAKNDRDSSVRKEAVIKLDRNEWQDLLADIARKDKDWIVRIEAVEKLDPERWQDILADISKSCKKCGRKVVPGLKGYTKAYSICYGPGNIKKAWREEKVATEYAAVWFPTNIPSSEPLFGGRCIKCNNFFCVICLKKAFLSILDKQQRLQKEALSDSKVNLLMVGVFLDENGRLYCPECEGDSRNVIAS